MSKLVSKEKVIKVIFHVGAYLGPTIHNGAAVGLKGVASIELLPNGVIVYSTQQNKKYRSFIPFTNVTSVDLAFLEAEAVEKAE